MTGANRPRQLDPLLLALRVIVYLLIGLLCFAAFVCVLLIPFALFFGEYIIAELAAEGIAATTAANGWLALFCALAAAALIAVIYLFWNLLAIVDTVRDGDPFVPANADRLTRMAWLGVVAHAIGFLMVWPGVHVAEAFSAPGEVVDFDLDFDGTGLILILVLFVLARVFRQGAAMRDDLEGTV